MKIHKTTIFTLAVCLAAFTGCNSDDSSSLSATEAVTEAQTEITTEAPTEPPTEEETQPVWDGIVIENAVYGYTLSAPVSFDTTDDGTVLTESAEITEDYYIIGSNTANDNLNIVADDYIPDEEFALFTKEYFEEQYNSFGIFEDLSVNVFEETEIDGFKGLRIELSAVNPSGEAFSQTQIIINRNDENAPFCYTFTYTDYTGEIASEIEESISSITFTEADPYFVSDACEITEPISLGDCGATLTLPGGWEATYGVEDGEITDSVIEFQTIVPVTETPAQLSLTISETADDEEIFKSYTKEDIEALFSDSFDTIEVYDFKTLEIGGYTAHKIRYNAGYESTDFSQSILLINCPDINKGISVILSDFSGSCTELSEELESIIKF